MSVTFDQRCITAAQLREAGSSPRAIAKLLGVSERSARTMIYNGRRSLAGRWPANDDEPQLIPVESGPPPWSEAAQKLRAKGWSVRGIARHLRADEPVVASVLNVEWGGQ